LGGRLVRAEEGLVLPARGQRLPDPAGTSLRLRGRLRKLAGRVVGGQKGVVLPARGQGLPAADDRVCHHLRTLRLRGRLRKLAGRVVCAQEGLVLRARGQGLHGDALPYYPLNFSNRSDGLVTPS